MNERIEQLARQVDAGYIPRYDMWQMDSETVQKFAELIVRECADIANQWQMSEHPGLLVKDVIIQHFGVDGMSTEDKKTLIKELLGVKND
jgi:hypothetical protein